MKKQEIEQHCTELVTPIIEEHGFELVDVEYVKEGSDYYLRVYADKEGGINIDDCVLISRSLEEKLDAANDDVVSMLVSDVKDGIDEKMEEAKEDAKDVADEKEKRQERLDALEEKRAVEKALIEGTKEAVDRAKEKQQRHGAPDMKLDEMLTLTTEHKQMNDVEQGLDDIKSSMKVLEADLKGIKVDKEV